MRKEDLFDAIGQTEKVLLERSEKRTKSNSRRFVAIAAAACLLIVGCFAVLPSAIRKQAEAPAEMGGYTGHAAGDEFMVYHGPVLPLTASEQTALTAERNIGYDFSPYIVHNITDGTYSYDGIETACNVTDSYVITNPTDEDITAVLSYPYVSSYRELAEEMPLIAVDGIPAETKRSAGAYSGGFAGVYGSENFENETYNLVAASSWADYAALLEDLGDLSGSLDDLPLPDEKLTVYEFTDFSAPEDAGDAATIAIEFYVKEGQRLYSYNTSGLSWDDETGWIQYSAFLPRKNRARPQESMLFAVSGGGIGEYTLQGYDNGSCEDDVKNDGVTAKVISYETTLGELLQKLIAELCRVEEWDNVPQELLYHSSAELLLTHGALSDDPKDRYADSPDTRLFEIIQETTSQERIFYEHFSVTVPAGGSVSVSAALRQNGSFDYQPAAEDAGIYGYDLLTKTDFLTITSAEASIEDHGVIDIVRQNYGFDPENDIRKVSLDLSVPRYYLEVRAKAE